MRTFIVFIVCFALSFKGMGQNQIHRVNFIICMDDRVLTGSMSDVRFSVKYKDSTSQDVKVTDYVPGDFRIADSDYVSLTREDVLSIALKFTKLTYTTSGDRVEKDYDISVGRSPFRGEFYILYIYNMDNPRHKGEFVNRRGKAYLSEYECSDGNTFILRTSKKAARW